MTVDSSFVVNQPSDTFISYAMTVIVTDARGDTTTARITIYINDTVTLAGDSYLVTTLTKAISSSAYSAARGTPGYTFSLASVTRSRLTSGDTSTISIGSTSGIVTANVSASTGYDTYTVVVRVTDVAGDTEQVTLTILVNDTISFTSAATSISTTYSRETTTTYVAIGGTTASTGGSGAITYSLSSITRSTNTTGDTSTISINSSSGLLTILATTQHDTYTVRIRATDSLGMYREVTLTLRVNESVAVSGAASIITTEGRETTTTFTASLGTGPYTYQILQASDSQAVSGISINGSGVVTISSSIVVNNLSDTYTMTVIATDAVGDSVTAQITIVINDTVTLSGDTYLVTTITKAISSSAFSAARGTPGYTFSIVSVTRSSGTDTSTISINSSSGV
ncbi:MAG: hypothetical protein EBY01_06375, partial [Actinobacteria bacterium]|nr:hypothetical protein [Actinomycetota bacterium]